MRKFLFFILITLCTPAFAQLAVEDDEQDEHIFTLNELTYFIDLADTLTIETASSPGFTKNFLRHGSYQNADFKSGAAYWIRMPVQHNSKSQKQWIFEFYDQTIDHLEAFVPLRAGKYRQFVTGDQYTFEKRTFLHKNFEIQLPHYGDTTIYYYFKVRSHDFADIRIAFRSIDRFVYYVQNEYFLYGTFYGMILIITLYNFLVYLAIREIKHIFYIFYILSVAFYAMSLDGIGFQFIWPNHPEWNNITAGIALYSLILWALIFTRRFLSTTANASMLDKVLKWTILARTLLFVFTLAFYPALFSYRNIEIIPLSMIFFTGIVVWYRGYRPARFFVIAYGILFSGFFVRMLVYLNILPFTIISHYSLHISFAIEMLFLTFALGDRIRILKDNRDRALRRIIHQHEYNMELKDKVNRELEEKVKERTRELDTKNHQLLESNQKLERQAIEINQINTMLDLDNWKLKNKIKEVLEERLMETTMSYDEFKTLYPDDLACYRSLESLKWGNGYQCRKCWNEKYFNGTQKFARRCTRCGYNESVTAFTIFHSIKFPIEKAFYIAYLAVSGKKENTLEVLSRMLGVGQNSVWGFRTKVIERIKGLEMRGRKPVSTRWEEVITEMPQSHQKPKYAVESGSN
ncbi:MAG TPA: 7TM diverse intracellular signaling domain-containing protein [Cyclobacteriaceae bacterium]|nr:7TM diverse intracellular signaling domain-containing protein [Cyclobacteriaceae bacterium]